MKYWPLFLLVLLLAACNPTNAVEAASTPARPITRSSLPDLGEAPELKNEIWFNTDQPLRLADLRGQVVLLDMWTFG